MRLSRWTMIFVVLALPIACRDATGPERVSAFFALQSVDGQPLPTVLFSDLTRTRTVVSSNLVLDTQGHAMITESDREDAQGIVTEPTLTLTLEYRLIGDHIEIGTFTQCSPNALCPRQATGTISNGILTLNDPVQAMGKVYVYRIVPTDPV